MQGTRREVAMADADQPVESEESEMQNATTVIYDITDACFDVFEHLVTATEGAISEEQDLMTTEVTEESYRDLKALRNSFAFWIDYTGALAPVGASLDDRLQNHDEINAMVVELLEMVDRNLRQRMSPFT